MNEQDETINNEFLEILNNSNDHLQSFKKIITQLPNAKELICKIDEAIQANQDIMKLIEKLD